MSVIVGLVLIYWSNGSNTRANRRGDNGHPCRVPHLMLKESDLYPAYFMYAFGFL